jgi:hypothetical protein
MGQGGLRQLHSEQPLLSAACLPAVLSGLLSALDAAQDPSGWAALVLQPPDAFPRPGVGPVALFLFPDRTFILCSEAPG